jgi:hypothetical protein
MKREKVKGRHFFEGGAREPESGSRAIDPTPTPTAAAHADGDGCASCLAV